MNSFSHSFLRFAGSVIGLCTALVIAADPPAPAPAKAPEKAAEKGTGKAIFDGKTLTGWKATAFAGAGEVTVGDGQMILPAGEPLTGVNYEGKVPKQNYEITLDAMRVDGSDFFCALTFPVGDACVTYVVGGWGGGVVGISSINSEDASENETTQYKKFDSGRWYKLKVRITPAKLEAWIDNEQMINLELENKKLGMRAGEIELSQPFGIATFRTKGALKNIQLRDLSAAK
jgi:hypothetical protein